MGIFDIFHQKKIDKEQPEEQKKDEIKERKARIEETFFATLDAKREEDPLIGAKVGSKTIYSQILDSLKEQDNRLNVDNLLLICSGLAGMSCQVTVRKLAEIKQLPVRNVLIEVGCKNGKNYYMGDNLNYFLIESQYSVYHLVVGIYHHLAPEKPLPDIHQYASTCVGNLGKEDYKIWGNVPEQEMIKINLSFWEKSHAVAERYCKNPEEIPILYGLMLQQAMTDAMKVLTPEKCLDETLENILFSAKLDYALFQSET